MVTIKSVSNSKSDNLYHYTSMDALCNMLCDYREHMSKYNLIFWASSIFTMNDPQEMIHGAEVLEILLPAIEKLFSLASENSLTIENLDTNKILKDTARTPFVLSFTSNEDDLGMWNLYGDKGCGVALVFSNEIKPDSVNVCGVSKLVKVNYNKGIDNYPNLAEIFNSGIMEWNSFNDPDKIRECKEKTLSSFYTQLCPYIKSGAYKKENEHRICFTDVPYNNVRFRTRNKHIIPYIEVPIPVNYLKGIQLGPCCNREFAEQSLRFLLNTCKLDIEISKSSIPYRNI